MSYKRYLPVWAFVTLMSSLLLVSCSSVADELIPLAVEGAFLVGYEENVAVVPPTADEPETTEEPAAEEVETEAVAEATSTEAATEATAGEGVVDEAVAEAEATESAEPNAPTAVTLMNLNMRSGPGVEYPIVGGAPMNTAYPVIGQALDCGWLQVTGNDGVPIWISGGSQYVEFSGPCDQVPAVEAPALPTAVPPTSAPVEETAPPVEEAPTPTPVEEAPPTAEAPATEEDPLPADQGCFLLENFISIELNVTLTAKNWNWNDNFKVAPMGKEVYCLAPGRYTWTVDAPPPWNEINGEFLIEAGDRFIWPIQAQP